MTTFRTDHLPLLTEEALPFTLFTDIVPTSLVSHTFTVRTWEEVVLVRFGLLTSTRIDLEVCHIIRGVVEEVLAADEAGPSIELVHLLRCQSQFSEPHQDCELEAIRILHPRYPKCS